MNPKPLRLKNFLPGVDLVIIVVVHWKKKICDKKNSGSTEKKKIIFLLGAGVEEPVLHGFHGFVLLGFGVVGGELGFLHLEHVQNRVPHFARDITFHERIRDGFVGSVKEP